MSLLVHSRSLGDFTPRNVHIRELLGGYELVFNAEFALLPAHPEITGAEIFGARVSIQGQQKPLGYARTDARLILRPIKDHPRKEYPAFNLTLTRQQLAAIEEIRNGGDLDFVLQIAGEGTHHEYGVNAMQDEWRFHVAESQWVKDLKSANIVEILLFELPVPIGAQSAEARKMTSHLEKAKLRFLNGDFNACVGECRLVVQEMGALMTKNGKWSEGLLKKLGVNNSDMTKEEREYAIFAALRHYTNLPHHGESEGGGVQFSRADASLALSLAALMAGHASRA